MKTHLKLLQISAFFILSFVILLSCKKTEEEPNMIPDPVLDQSYQGALYVTYTSTLPPWSVSTSMDVFVDKELGVLTIDNGTLSYAGDTIIQEDSKMVRSGQWKMYPIGTLMEDAGRKYIDVDVQLEVQNDILQIYAKDNNGNWVLVNETPFNETPYSVVSFDFLDATTSSSTVSVQEAGGSIIWTLAVMPVITP